MMAMLVMMIWRPSAKSTQIYEQLNIHIGKTIATDDGDDDADDGDGDGDGDDGKLYMYCTLWRHRPEYNPCH